MPYLTLAIIVWRYIMPRRKDNEIYEYKLKSGKTKYGFKTYVGINKETGKPVKVTRQGFSTRKEAEQAKTKIKADGAGKVVNKHNDKQNKKTLQQVYETWLEIYKVSVRESTLLRTTVTWKRVIKPEFEDNYVNFISITHLQKFVDNIARNYVEFRPPINLLHRVIKYAILRGWCKTDPFDKIIMPTKTTKKSSYPKNNFYNLNELKEFLATAKKYNLMHYVYFMVLGNLGLRSGEAFALQWKNINFSKKTVHIEHTVARGANYKKTINPTKTQQSNRTLLLSDNLIAILKEYKSKTVFSKPEDFIFHAKNGDFLAASTSGDWINRVYRHNSNLRRITPHGFRHTLASLLYEGNKRITPKDIQMVLGHSTVKTSLDIYTHVTENQKENIQKSINDLDL